MENIRRAKPEDLSRIAEILVFVKRIKYRSIFHNDDYSFNELQVVKLVEKYGMPKIIENLWVYDDGIVKGMIHIEGKRIAELYVDYFFWNQGIGSKLIEFAKDKFDVRFLWVLEKNQDAIRFYESRGFQLNGKKQLEEGTTEYLVMLERMFLD